MNLESFLESLREASPPPGLSDALLALWHAGKKDWGRAHDIAQDIHTPAGSWIHAYLHRWEGDQWNARYWYTRAGKAMPSHSLEAEWEHIVRALLSDLA